MVKKKDILEVVKLFCFFGIHNWYYGDFQTGQISNFTGDHIGIRGRVCLDCRKKQKSEAKKYITIESFKESELK